jgi:predicted kinase
MRDLAMRAGAGFALVACSAPESEMASRLAERQRQGLDASDAGVEVLKRQLGFVEPVTADEQDCTHAIVNDGDLDTLRQRVFALSAWW